MQCNINFRKYKNRSHILILATLPRPQTQLSSKYCLSVAIPLPAFTTTEEYYLLGYNAM
jgi:hypothetical protein